MSTLNFMPIENVIAEKFSKYLILVCMIYLSLLLSTEILTSKIIIIVDTFTTLAGTLIVPVLFITLDIVSEVYGYKTARMLMWYGFFCQFIFSVMCTIFIYAPYPAFWHGQSSYEFVLSPLMRISFFSTLSYVTSSYINIALISKWKISMKGKYFWLRSMGASTIGELLFTIIGVATIQYHRVTFDEMMSIALSSYAIKVIFSIAYAIPANLICYFLKIAEDLPLG